MKRVPPPLAPPYSDYSKDQFSTGSVGIILAIFYVLIFPGNLAQYLNGTDAFGLDTDRARFVRLFFQPALIIAALWSTGVIKLTRSI